MNNTQQYRQLNNNKNGTTEKEIQLLLVSEKIIHIGGNGNSACYYCQDYHYRRHDRIPCCRYTMHIPVIRIQ